MINNQIIKVSIIIPCRNEEINIANCIDSLLKMQSKDLIIELIIVDGLSKDNTIQIVNNYVNSLNNIKIIKNVMLTTPYALNLGIKHSSYNYIMIASAHSSFNIDYLKILVNEMNDPAIAAVGGVVLTDVRNLTPKSSAIKKVLTNKFGVGNSIFRIGTDKPTYVDIIPFGLYKKEIYSEIGLYNNMLIRNQDMEFAKRILREGKKLKLIPSAKCTYFARETFRAFFKNNYGNGLWVFPTVMITKTFRSLSLRHFIPIIFILSLLLPFFLINLSSHLILIPFISLIAYFIFILVISLKLKDDSTNLLYLIQAFTVLHFSYGFGSLIGLFRLHFLFKKNEIEYL